MISRATSPAAAYAARGAGWDGFALADGQITTLFAHGGAQSLALLSATDIVRQFSGYSSGYYVQMLADYPLDRNG